MEPTGNMFLGLLMRWIHVTSVVVLIGGILYARYLCSYSPRFRNWIYVCVIALLGSGLYNFFTKAAYPRGYHMWFGIKMLLVLHVFATAVLITLPTNNEAKRARRMSGLVYSSLAIFLISAYLRWISLA
ncbi:MAG: hypothetical protein KIT09_20295 [Bryobacteraceae bacterium]|nr:hypothetical protein [Bryobacteraceae bacterium]